MADAALHERLARLCGDQLRDEAAELRHLERVAELDPSRGDMWRTLADRYEQEGRTEDQIEAMERELGSGCGAERLLTLHARLAELHLQERKDPVAARSHYERVFELDPSHAAAAQFLIGRYDRDRRPEEVIRVLEARLSTLAAETDRAVEEVAFEGAFIRRLLLKTGAKYYRNAIDAWLAERVLERVEPALAEGSAAVRQRL